MHWNNGGVERIHMISRNNINKPKILVLTEVYWWAVVMIGPLALGTSAR